MRKILFMVLMFSVSSCSSPMGTTTNDPNVDTVPLKCSGHYTCTTPTDPIHYSLTPVTSDPTQCLSVDPSGEPTYFEANGRFGGRTGTGTYKKVNGRLTEISIDYLSSPVPCALD